MIDYVDILQETKIFEGISKLEITHMLHCIPNHLNTYSPGEFVFRSGEFIDTIYIVLSGSVQIENIDYWGNVNIVGNITRANAFGEAFAFASKKSEQTARVVLESKVLVLDSKKMLTMCSNACLFHAKLIDNIVAMISNKNTFLNKKMSYLSERSIRRKLLSYLSDCELESNEKVFSIKYNRQELADFLSVDRSAMSKELSKLKKEGILDYKKNKFELFEN